MQDSFLWLVYNHRIFLKVIHPKMLKPAMCLKSFMNNYITSNFGKNLNTRKIEILFKFKLVT